MLIAIHAQGPLDDHKIWHSTDVTLFAVGMQQLAITIVMFIGFQLIIDEDRSRSC